MDTLLYAIGNQLYINLTNRCPCSCNFCIRNETDALGDAGSLWLREGEHPAEEYIKQLKSRDINQYKEVIFCGYGEPTERLTDLTTIAGFLKENYQTPVRLNTNGLSDLIYGRDTAPDFKGKLDAVSISLNAPDAESYLAITNSRFGLASFDAMLNFTKNVKRYVPTVMMSVVDVIPKEDIAKCQKICERIGVPLRVRVYG